MAKNSKFFVTVPVKPYVRRFLEMNYGNPVNLICDPVSHKFLRELLKKPNSRFDNKYPDNFCTYTTEVEVLISDDDFYRHGFELTKTNMVAFGRHFEDRAKVLMRNVVGVYGALGVPLNVSITKFQERFGFDEDTWSYQTIKKDFYRNGTLNKIDFNTEIFSKIEKIVLVNLYSLGTISHKIIKQYENVNEAG